MYTKFSCKCQQIEILKPMVQDFGLFINTLPSQVEYNQKFTFKNSSVSIIIKAE
jgi:hypothetical protein